MRKIAIIGTQGVPANYGGFETLVDNIIGEKHAPELHYTVFCSSKDMRPTRHVISYKGAKLRYVHLKANGIQSPWYDGISLLKAANKYDVVLVLGVSGGIFFPLFKLSSRKKIIVNIDGVEWKREKWGRLTKIFLRFSEKIALHFSDTIVADNQGIVESIPEKYRKKTVMIAYGGDHAAVEGITQKQHEKILEQHGVHAEKYYISLCRIEPENNCELILDTFARNGKKLLFIGNWQRCDYGCKLREKYSKFDNIKMLDPIYEQEILYTLRTHSSAYIHGHSAGGTNPSLVEAMFCGCNVFAFDVVFNRETTENKALYFKNSDELSILINDEKKYENNSENMHLLAREKYKWSGIARQYEDIFNN